MALACLNPPGKAQATISEAVLEEAQLNKKRESKQSVTRIKDGYFNNPEATTSVLDVHGWPL